jgi:hypothetical protein
MNKACVITSDSHHGPQVQISGEHDPSETNVERNIETIQTLFVVLLHIVFFPPKYYS